MEIRQVLALIFRRFFWGGTPWFLCSPGLPAAWTRAARRPLPLSQG